MPKDPRDVLGSIDDDALDDEVERVASMTAEQRREALREAGVDVASLHERADALHDRAQGAKEGQAVDTPRQDAPVRSLRPGPRRTPARIRSPRGSRPAAAAIVVGAGAYVAATRPPDVAKAPDAAEHAQALRARGADGVRRRAMARTCLARLDEAKALDPPGDAAPDVQIAPAAGGGGRGRRPGRPRRGGQPRARLTRAGSTPGRSLAHARRRSPSHALATRSGSIHARSAFFAA